jgi:hypothetical protein
MSTRLPSLLRLDYTHDDEPGQAKTVIIDAVRFASQNGFSEPRPPLDEAD